MLSCMGGGGGGCMSIDVHALVYGGGGAVCQSTYMFLCMGGGGGCMSIDVHALVYGRGGGCMSIDVRAGVPVLFKKNILSYQHVLI